MLLSYLLDHLRRRRPPALLNPHRPADDRIPDGDRVPVPGRASWTQLINRGRRHDNP